MEHSLHLSAKHFVEAVTPSSPKKIAQKVKCALTKAQHEGDIDLEQLNMELEGFDGEDDSGEDEDGDHDTDFNVGDAVGKALALVKQVSYCWTASLYHIADI
jgi:hypothetical protein